MFQISRKSTLPPLNCPYHVNPKNRTTALLLNTALYQVLGISKDNVIYISVINREATSVKVLVAK